MSEDFPQPIKANRKKLYPLFVAAKRCEEFSQVSLKLDVFINGSPLSFICKTLYCCVEKKYIC